MGYNYLVVNLVLFICVGFEFLLVIIKINNFLYFEMFEFLFFVFFVNLYNDVIGFCLVYCFY